MKITFLALSGVRCHDEALMELGLTLPGFVERSRVIASLPSLGLLTLAGQTPAGIEIEYIEVPDPRTLETLPGSGDAVAISSFSAQIKEAYALADRYRQAGVTVILGGLHVTGMPDEAAAHADAIVIGEGEPVWPRVVADLRDGRLLPRYDARGTTFDLAQSPMPRFDLLDPSHYNRITIQATRGCPFDCEFCAASIRLNPRYRAKPIPRVLDELAEIRRIWPHPFIEFADDNTFADKRHGRELARALIGQEVRWFTETDISVAEDAQLLEWMREGGCAQVLIGLESPSAADLDGLERKSNWKRRRQDRYRRAIAAIQDAGITVNGCFVLGLDHSDGGAFDEVFDFVRETGLYEVQVTVMTAFPATPLHARLEAAGRILEPGAWEKCTLFDVNYQPARMSVSELESGFRDLVQRVYDPAFVEERRRRYFARQDALRRERSGHGTEA